MKLAGMWRTGKARRLGSATIVAVVVIAALLALASHVQAAAFGGSWAVAPGAPLVISYNDTACADPSYRLIIEDAAAQWNQTDSPAAFVRTDSSDMNAVQLFVCTGFDDGPQGDYWGVTTLYDGAWNECLACRYGHAKVFLNRSELDAESIQVRLKTATHELGHVMGLAHPAKNDHTAQIMRQGWNGYDMPQPQDVANLNLLYPGWISGTAKPAEITPFLPLPQTQPAPAATAVPQPSGDDGGALGR
jgi:hypothetical protein